MGLIFCLGSSNEIKRRSESMNGILKFVCKEFVASLCSLLILMTIGCSDKQPLPNDENALGFDRDIKEVMSKFCFECHGIEATEAGLDLRTLESILSGGESGPAIVPGQPDKSILFDMIHNEHMPPEGELLGTDDIERIRKWIASGARP